MPGSQIGSWRIPCRNWCGSAPRPPSTGPEFGTWLLVAKGQLPSDWVAGTLAPSWRVQGLREMPLPAESPGWWGTGKVTEFCAYLPDLSVLYQLVTSVRQEHLPLVRHRRHRRPVRVLLRDTTGVRHDAGVARRPPGRRSRPPP